MNVKEAIDKLQKQGEDLSNLLETVQTPDLIKKIEATINRLAKTVDELEKFIKLQDGE